MAPPSVDGCPFIFDDNFLSLIFDKTVFYRDSHTAPTGDDGFLHFMPWGTAVTILIVTLSLAITASSVGNPIHFVILSLHSF